MSTSGDIMSTSGDIMMHVRDTMSTSGVVQYNDRGPIVMHVGAHFQFLLKTPMY